jgi:hypothetical protein
LIDGDPDIRADGAGSATGKFKCIANLRVRMLPIEMIIGAGRSGMEEDRSFGEVGDGRQPSPTAEGSEISGSKQEASLGSRLKPEKRAASTRICDQR